MFPYQAIQLTADLPVLFRRMKKRVLDNQQIKNDHLAIFTDTSGNPMSGTTYKKRFNKVKRAFIKWLENSNGPLRYWAPYLKNHTWTTHIGRGIYTNLMAQFVKTPMELALLRGDSTIEATLHYLSRKTIRNEVQEGLDNMFSNNIGSLEAYQMRINDGVTYEKISEINEQYSIQSLFSGINVFTSRQSNDFSTRISKNHK